MQLPEIIKGVEPECLSLVQAHNAVNWTAEQNYAMQLLSANSFALQVAHKNPVSVQNALRNAAAIGVSLCPADKHAYLVPRSGAICLDVSYMGLIHLATESGSIEFGQAKLVYANDFYESNGIDKAPTHRYQAFGNRGELVGAYCVVKTSKGAYLTDEMDINQLNAIKARSESAKRNSGPWITDFEEMCRKTVVKRGAKYWPKADRLNQAIQYLNTDGGEGINKEDVARDVTPISQDLEMQLIDYRNSLEPEKQPAFDAWLKKPISQLTNEEAKRALTALNGRGAK